MQMAQEDAAITCGYGLIGFRSRTRFCKFRRRHNDQKLVSRLRQENEFFSMPAPPTGGNRDPILLVDGMPEFSGVEAFGLGIGVHWSSGTIVHFAPLDPTFNHLRNRRSIKIFSHIAPSRRRRKLLGS